MTATEIKERFPNATPDFIRLNATCDTGKAGVPNRDTGAAPVLERHPRDGAVGEIQVQERVSSRVLVRVTSVRKRLLDEDNLCEKYHCDLLRYAGIIVSDAPGQAKIEVCQEKAEPGGEEFTRIEVFEM
jgi:hypothetical protein